MKRKPQRKEGRPPKITAAVVEKVAETMSYGVPEEYACALHGVNPATFGPAVSRSEAFKAIKRRHDARFIERACKGISAGGEIEQLANAEGETRDVRKPWQGLAWLLERRHWKDFMKKDRVEVTGKDGGGVLGEADMLELERIVKARVLGKAGAE